VNERLSPLYKKKAYRLPVTGDVTCTRRPSPMFSESRPIFRSSAFASPQLVFEPANKPGEHRFSAPA
jgi:hypothetical protein